VCKDFEVNVISGEYAVISQKVGGMGKIKNVTNFSKGSGEV
jgi:hypothetical protein